MARIIIIGASSGLGRQIALDFARCGLTVGIGARRVDMLEEIRTQYPDRIFTRYIDVTASDAVGDFNKLIMDTGGMDILLYAAGTGFRDPELDDARLTNTLATNVTGFARITAEAYKYFRRNASVEKAQIAAITSIAGTKGIGVSAAYSASKRFQQTFLQALDQLAHQQHVNVTITDIRPGFVRTDFIDADAHYPMTMGVAYAARRIELAMLQRKRVAVIDGRWRVVNALWRLIPDALWPHIGISF